MKHITSRDNAFYKELKNLSTSSQVRRKAGQTILDGVHLCQAYLEAVGQPHYVIVNEAALQNPEIADLLTKTSCQFSLSDALYQSLSQVENGVGIFFVVPIPVVKLPEKIVRTAVVLESIQDPGNLGSLLRSAAAAGIKQIFCSHETVSAWSPKVLRAGMGAHFLLDIHENVDLSALLAESTISILATSSHAQKNVYDCDLSQSVIWMFGHEGRGISDNLMGRATDHIKIPHLGNIESLNVAACAAICFFEQVRQGLLSSDQSIE